MVLLRLFHCRGPINVMRVLIVVVVAAARAAAVVADGVPSGAVIHVNSDAPMGFANLEFG